MPYWCRRRQREITNVPSDKGCILTEIRAKIESYRFEVYTFEISEVAISKNRSAKDLRNCRVLGSLIYMLSRRGKCIQRREVKNLQDICKYYRRLLN